MPYHFPIKPGDRVALAPHLDLWMQGVRFADVREIKKTDGFYLVALQYPNGNRILRWLQASDLLGAVRHPSGQFPRKV